MREGLHRWHEVVRLRDPLLLHDLLDADVVFHSPVLHRPVEGRELVTLYLAGAMQVLGDRFRYVRQLESGDHAVLEFESVIDGLIVNGVDMITFDEAGRITDFKVMLRPLSATMAVKERMAALLASGQAP